MIVPRWEWRTFGEGFEPVEARLAAASSPRTEESDEIYLVSLRSDASAKVRGGRLDAKRLLAVGDDGLEQWRPVLKAPVPVGAPEARELFTLLGLAGDSLTLASYDAEALAGASDELVAVAVRKLRRHYAFGGCMAEVTELRTDTGSTRTLALESEDPARVTEALRALGLDGLENVCVARGLKRLLGIGPARFAVVDVGTNSVKLHVAERYGEGAWRAVADGAEITRLGEGLGETGRLADAPIERTADAVARMAAEASRHGAGAVVAVGTAGLRIATNSRRFTDAVRRRSGIDVAIISAEEEARLAYLGATRGLALAAERLAVFDSGGGSTQFTFAEGGRVGERFSLNVGAVGVTERFGLHGPVTGDVLERALAHVATRLVRLDGHAAPDAVVGMGGAVTNLAAVSHGLAAYDPEIIQGTLLERAEIERQIELYAARTAEERRRIPGLQPARAEVILAGAIIVLTVLAKLRQGSLLVSDRGLRHGVLQDRFGLTAATS